VRRYAHPSRLFFFSLHLYDKEDPHHIQGHGAAGSDSTAIVPVKANPDLPIDAVTALVEDDASPVTAAVASGSATPQRRYEFYPGTGVKDDHIHNIVNVPLLPLWAKDDPVSAKVSQLSGREGYRQAIQQRLIPSLRAFNPTLILLSIGFDAAAGDVGNTRQIPGEGTRMGIDLLPEDFAWATTEIMKIADICCSGRLVSVLEGGYGEYAALNKPSAVAHVPTTRGAARQSAPAPVAAVETEKSLLNRNLLARVAAAHVHRLVDPYGPSSHLSQTTAHPAK